MLISLDLLRTAFLFEGSAAYLRTDSVYRLFWVTGKSRLLNNLWRFKATTESAERTDSILLGTHTCPKLNTTVGWWVIHLRPAQGAKRVFGAKQPKYLVNMMETSAHGWLSCTYIVNKLCFQNCRNMKQVHYDAASRAWVVYLELKRISCKVIKNDCLT